MVYICSKFRENILSGFRVMESKRNIFNTNITKGHNSVNPVQGDTILVLCISSGYGLHLYQVSRNILNSFRVMERKQFQYLLIQRGIIL